MENKVNDKQKSFLCLEPEMIKISSPTVSIISLSAIKIFSMNYKGSYINEGHTIL